MKKGILVLALGVFVLSSCKKEYACTCTTGLTVTEETHKGKDAESACSDASSVINLKVCVPK